MPVPDRIVELVTNALDLMRSDPEHRLDWRIRRDLYRAFAQHPSGPHAHSWLAILAAEHVLPIFVHAVPDDDLPTRLLQMAKQVATGEADPNSDAYYMLHDDGYHNYWEGIENRTVEYAGRSAYKAMVEAAGDHDLLENVETLRRGTYSTGEVINSIGGTEDGAQWVTGATFTDEDIAHLAAYSDTASPASLAWAISESGDLLDPQRSLQFWEWWLLTALPEAWQKAVE